MEKKKGIVIYQPSGAAAEYCPWACNLYNGCTNRCEYCYNRHCQAKNVLGKDDVTPKRGWTEDLLFAQFKKELDKWEKDIIMDGGGLHFNFVSDPCLPETYRLNLRCIRYAMEKDITVYLLTKMHEWIDTPEWQEFFASQIFQENKLYISFGFTLTGMDELEPGASTNDERIKAMERLYKMGCCTWASVEPMIDLERSKEMVKKTLLWCDSYKFGLLSGKKSYTKEQVHDFVNEISDMIHPYGSAMYFKESVTKFLNQ